MNQYVFQFISVVAASYNRVVFVASVSMNEWTSSHSQARPGQAAGLTAR